MLLLVNTQSSQEKHNNFWLMFGSYLRLPREILFAPAPLLARLSLSTLSGEVRDEEKLESRVEENAPECRLLRPPYPLSLNIELEAVLG